MASPQATWLTKPALTKLLSPSAMKIGVDRMGWGVIADKLPEDETHAQTANSRSVPLHDLATAFNLKGLDCPLLTVLVKSSAGVINTIDRLTQSDFWHQ